MSYPNLENTDMQNFKSFNAMANAINAEQNRADVAAAKRLARTSGARKANKQRAAERKQADLAARVAEALR